MTIQVICEYGVRHPATNGKYTCNCCTTFGYSYFKLQDFCEKKYNVYHSNDITSSMRKEMYLEIQKK